MTLPKMRDFPTGSDLGPLLMQCLHCGLVMSQSLLHQVAHENVCDGDDPTPGWEVED